MTAASCSSRNELRVCVCVCVCVQLHPLYPREVEPVQRNRAAANEYFLQ